MAAKKKKTATKKKTAPAAKKKKKAPAAAKTTKKTAAPKKKEAPKTPKKTKKKAAAGKPTPRTSPVRGVSVEAWASKKLSGWQADALRIIQALVVRHAPDATASIKWGQPVWEHNGPFAWARPAAKHFSFGFWRGAEMSDPEGRLEGEGDRMRHVKITSAEQISELPLASYVEQAIALNATKGDPTKR